MEPMGPGAQQDQWGPLAPLANRISTTTPKSRGRGGSLAYTSLLAWVELNLSLSTSTPPPQQEAIQIETSASVLGIANSVFDRHACAVHLKKNNCNALPVPLPRQVPPCREPGGFFLRCFGGSKTGPKNGTKKGSQNGPQMDSKRDPRGTKMGLKTGSRKGSRKGYPSGRVNSAILLLFTVFQQGRASQKSITFGTTFGTILGPKVSKRGVLKSTSEIGAKMAPFWDPCGTHLGSTWSQNRVNKGTPKAKRLQGPSEDLEKYHFGPQNG